MNDFTKEELRKLLHGLGLINDIPCMVLENKIQSLIENYCEHEIHPEFKYECMFCGKDMTKEDIELYMER